MKFSYSLPATRTKTESEYRVSKVAGKVCPRAQQSCGHLKKIENILRRAPENRRIFIMVEINDDTKRLIKNIKKIAKGKNMIAQSASMKRHCDDLYCNICMHIKTSKFGIAIFSPTSTHEFNPNVMYETGLMHAFGKRCLLIFNENIKSGEVPSDLTHIIRERFNPNNLRSINRKISEWLNKEY